MNQGCPAVRIRLSENEAVCSDLVLVIRSDLVLLIRSDWDRQIPLIVTISRHLPNVNSWP